MTTSEANALQPSIGQMAAAIALEQAEHDRYTSKPRKYSNHLAELERIEAQNRELRTALRAMRALFDVFSKEFDLDVEEDR